MEWKSRPKTRIGQVHSSNLVLPFGVPSSSTSMREGSEVSLSRDI